MGGGGRGGGVKFLHNDGWWLTFGDLGRGHIFPNLTFLVFNALNGKINK